MYKTRVRHIGRMKEVMEILTRYGLSFIFDKGRQIDPAQVRIRKALEELGPTFIKLGQVLSTRPDLIPSEYIEELRKLQDEVAHVEFQQVKNVLESEIGASVQELFKSIDAKPLAAASIGQVHRACLHSGEQVVIKVQRPKVNEIIQTDLEIIFDLARLVQARSNVARFYDLVELVEEFSSSILDEIDYTSEGRNADRLAKMSAYNNEVIVPKVYWNLTSTRVLTLSYIESQKIDNKEQLLASGYNLTEIAKRLCNALFTQIFINGFFHGDPHPGNVGVCESENIVFFDFGLMGRLDEKLKNQLMDLLLAIVRRDSFSVVKVLIDIGQVQGKINRQKLQKEIDKLLEKYYYIPFNKLQVGQVLREILHLAYHYQIKVPSEITILVKAFVTLEAVVSNLDPSLSIVQLAEPFANRLLKEKLSPQRIRKKLSTLGTGWYNFLFNVPARLDNVLLQIEEGQTRLVLEHKGVTKFLNGLDRIVNKIAVSIILGGLVIGSSLVVNSAHSLFLYKLPIAEIGFLTATMIGLWLVISILKSGRI